MRRRPKVLIVDDDPGLIVGLMRELFRDNDKYDLLFAGSAEVAQLIMREIPVDLLVTDIYLPGMSGVDLLCWVSSEWPQTFAVVMTGLGSDELRDKVYRHGALHILQKPFRMGQLREMVLSILQHELDQNLMGTLSRVSLADILQMFCLSGQSAALSVVDGKLSGMVWVVKGEIVHAVANDNVGQEALQKLLRSRTGQFRSVEVAADPPRTITGTWQHLLIEAMRVADESRRAAVAAPLLAAASPKP